MANKPAAHLRNAFEVLTEARERFYPVNSYLIDLTLVAATTLGAELRERTGRRPCPRTCCSPAKCSSGWRPTSRKRSRPCGWPWIIKRPTSSAANIAKPNCRCCRVESVLAEFRHGLATFQRRCSAGGPAVFGRRRFGPLARACRILCQLGYQGALHMTLDDGQFPQSDQCKTRWEGFGASAIDALCRLPLDAHAPDSFLHLPRKIGESMDTGPRGHDRICPLARPGQPVLSRSGSGWPSTAQVLGKFVTLSDYFANTDRPGDLTRFKADQYRSPYLRQAIIRDEADPLSHADRLARPPLGSRVATGHRAIRAAGHRPQRGRRRERDADRI